MLTVVNGNTCEITELDGKYIDVKFQDEVTVSTETIMQLVGMFQSGRYYALRIITVNYNLTEALRQMGFQNGNVLWSQTQAAPYSAIQQHFENIPSEGQVYLGNGDLVLSTVGYEPSMGLDDLVPVDMLTTGGNLFIHDPDSSLRVINKLWDCIDDSGHVNYNLFTDFKTTPEVSSFLKQSGLAIRNMTQARYKVVGYDASGALVAYDDFYGFIVNHISDGISIMGQPSDGISWPQLSNKHLWFMNGHLNIPPTEMTRMHKVTDYFSILRAYHDKVQQIVFQFNNAYFLYAPKFSNSGEGTPELDFFTEIQVPPPGAYNPPVPTPIGMVNNSSPVFAMCHMKE